MYRVEYLPDAIADILDAEAYLHELSPAAADRFTEAIRKKTATLAECPLTYRISRYDQSLRCVSLLYKYLCFYSVDEAARLVRVYRILRGMRDISNIL